MLSAGACCQPRKSDGWTARSITGRAENESVLSNISIDKRVGLCNRCGMQESDRLKYDGDSFCFCDSKNSLPRRDVDRRDLAVHDCICSGHPANHGIGTSTAQRTSAACEPGCRLRKQACSDPDPHRSRIGIRNPCPISTLALVPQPPLTGTSLDGPHGHESWPHSRAFCAADEPPSRWRRFGSICNPVLR